MWTWHQRGGSLVAPAATASPHEPSPYLKIARHQQLVNRYCSKTIRYASAYLDNKAVAAEPGGPGEPGGARAGGEGVGPGEGGKPGLRRGAVRQLRGVSGGLCALPAGQGPGRRGMTEFGEWRDRREKTLAVPSAESGENG